MTKRIIVLGFPRSGTGSMAKELGLGHEVINEIGTSDWRLVFDYEKQEGDEVIHIIRNPIDSISSNLFTMKKSSLDFIAEKTSMKDMSVLATLINGFIKWTEKIEEIKPDKIIRAEDLETKVNTRPHPKIKWGDLDGIPIDDLNKLKEVAIRYGYDTND